MWKVFLLSAPFEQSWHVLAKTKSKYLAFEHTVVGRPQCFPFSYMAQSFFQVSETFDDYISLPLIQIETIWDNNLTANSLLYVFWTHLIVWCLHVFTPCCLVVPFYNLIQHLSGGFKCFFFTPPWGRFLPFWQSHFFRLGGVQPPPPDIYFFFVMYRKNSPSTTPLEDSNGWIP